MQNESTTKVKTKKVREDEISIQVEQLEALGMLLELKCIDSYDTIAQECVFQCPFTEPEQDKIKAKMFDIIDNW